MRRKSLAWQIAPFLLLGAVACKPRSYSDQGNTSSTPGETAAQSAAAVEDAIAAERLLGDPSRFAETNFNQADGARVIRPDALRAPIDTAGRAIVAYDLAVNYLRERGFRLTPTRLIPDPIVLQATPGELTGSSATFKIGFQPASGAAPVIFEFLAESRVHGIHLNADGVRTEIVRLVAKMIEQVERRMVHVVGTVQSDIIPIGEIKTKFLAAAERVTAAQMAEAANIQAGELPSNWRNGSGGGGELGRLVSEIPRGSPLYDSLMTQDRLERQARARRTSGGTAQVAPQQALITQLEDMRAAFQDKPAELGRVNGLIDAVRRMAGRAGR